MIAVSTDLEMLVLDDASGSLPYHHYLPKEWFATPFWTVEKRWLVICNIFPSSEVVEMYISPICSAHWYHVPGPNTKTISNFERDDQSATVLESVIELRVDPYRIRVDEQVI